MSGRDCSAARSVFFYMPAPISERFGLGPSMRRWLGGKWLPGLPDEAKLLLSG